MKSLRFPRLRLVAVFCAIAAAAPSSAADPPLRAAASVPPVAGLARALGAGRWTCDSVVRTGADPHTWEPSPRDVAALSGARLFFASGMPFEKVLAAKVSARNHDLRVVELGEGGVIENEHDAHGSHGAHDSHSDLHGWLSPHELAEWAESVSAAFAELDPDGAPAYAKALADTKAGLDALERELRQRLPKGIVFGAVHPAYGAFAEAFGLEQVALETDGHEPGPRALARARNRLRSGGARVILVQNDAEARLCSSVASECSLRVVRVSPLSDDPLSAIREIAAAVAPDGDGEKSVPEPASR